MPSKVFAHDFKFIADLITHSKEDVQAVVNIVANWADAHSSPLSIEKCFVMHCERRQLKHEYHNNSLRIKCLDCARDIGVMRSNEGACSEHCNAVISKVTKVCGMLRLVFHSRHRKLLLPAFTYYMRLILPYCTPA